MPRGGVQEFSLSQKCRDVIKLCFTDYYTPRQHVLLHTWTLGGLNFSLVALFSRLINVVGLVAFLVSVFSAHLLWPEESPMIVPMLRKASEWTHFDVMSSLAKETVASSFDCDADAYQFLAPVPYESSRFNSVLCSNATAYDVPLQTIQSSGSVSWACATPVQSKERITAATYDSSSFLAIPTVDVVYGTKQRTLVPQCNKTDLVNEVSIIRDVESTVVEVGFFVSTMRRFEEQSDAVSNAAATQKDDTFTALAGEFQSVKLVDTTGTVLLNCPKSDGQIGICEWTWAADEEPSHIFVTVGNLLQAAGVSSLQESNENFKTYYEGRADGSVWPSSDTSLAYSYQITGIEIAIVVRWNNAPVCDGLAFEFGEDEDECTSSTTGSRPLVGEISVTHNPTFRTLQSTVSADGTYSESFGVRITLAGGGYIVGEYDPWLLYLPLVCALIVVSFLTCVMETCMFMRCKETLLPKGTPLHMRVWMIFSSVLTRCSGLGLPKKCSRISEFCRFIWHTKTRIGHIRKKFALQQNFHKQQDDFLDEEQVLLHRVTFKPHSIRSVGHREEVSRQQLRSLLATIMTDRSQLERIVRKEIESIRNEKNTNLSSLNARLATLNILITSGISEDEMETIIQQPLRKADRHRNLLRAMFLEFADVIASALHDRGAKLKPPSRDSSLDGTEDFNSATISDTEEMDVQWENSDDDSDASSTKRRGSSVGSIASAFSFDSDDGASDDESDDGRRRHESGEEVREFCMELQNVGFDFDSDENDDFEGL